ncbi:MAG TPA: hypothetical protein PLO53_10600 [Candidatus Hydrogenedentes bacterium]|nr:hypothetical protein [Candidatus Hydrogenedentota bacterium]HPU98389.1 hypothetical protein [Candidatus Hydrogenedentota bacterium]
MNSPRHPEGDRRGIPAGQPTSARPWLGIYFSCCRVYARIFLNPNRDTFTAHCPRCARPLRIRITPDGCTDRFWIAE